MLGCSSMSSQNQRQSPAWKAEESRAASPQNPARHPAPYGSRGRPRTRGAEGAERDPPPAAGRLARAPIRVAKELPRPRRTGLACGEKCRRLARGVLGAARKVDRCEVARPAPRAGLQPRQRGLESLDVQSRSILTCGRRAAQLQRPLQRRRTSCTLPSCGPAFSLRCHRPLWIGDPGVILSRRRPRLGPAYRLARLASRCPAKPSLGLPSPRPRLGAPHPGGDLA